MRRIGISLSGTRKYVPGRFRHPASGDINISMYVINSDKTSLFSDSQFYLLHGSIEMLKDFFYQLILRGLRLLRGKSPFKISTLYWYTENF
jgi:hypothetical protein